MFHEDASKLFITVLLWTREHKNSPQLKIIHESDSVFLRYNIIMMMRDDEEDDECREEHNL